MMRMIAVLAAGVLTGMVAGCGSSSHGNDATAIGSMCAGANSYATTSTALASGTTQVSTRAQAIGYLKKLVHSLAQAKQGAPSSVQADIAAVSRTWSYALKYVQTHKDPTSFSNALSTAPRSTDAGHRLAAWTQKTCQSHGAAAVCQVGNSYYWYTAYSNGKYGGPPTDSYVVQKLFYAITGALGRLRSVVPASQAGNLKAAADLVGFYQTYYSNHGYALSNAQYKTMLRKAPHEKSQLYAFDVWLKKTCTAGGKTWPTRPADASKVVG